MALVNFITKLFGNKYEKDVKNIMPIVEDINNNYSQLHSISNDELREKTQELKNYISESLVIHTSICRVYIVDFHL